MATTQESYRYIGRNPRYMTKLSAFANGMYWSDQTIPEGYAKVLVNYDIDDTGNSITPRPGRQKDYEVTITSALEDYGYGSIHTVNTLYKYDVNNESTSLVELLKSFGMPVNPVDCNLDTEVDNYMRPFYLSTLITTDTYNYEDLGWSGTYTTANKLDINSDKEYGTTGILGSVTARTFKDVNTFSKNIMGTWDRSIQQYYGTPLITRPVYTELNNELYLFMGSAPSKIDGVVTIPNDFALTKMIINYDSTQPTAHQLIEKYTPIEPMDLNPTQAYANGFNLLSKTPYTFNDTQSGVLNTLGIVPYKTSSDFTVPRLRYVIGEPLVLRCYYSYGASTQAIQYKVEYIDRTNPNASWTVLHDFNASDAVTPGNALHYTYTPKTEISSVRFTLRDGNDTTTEVIGYIPIDTTINPDVRDEDLKAYDLSTAKGLINWQGCLGLYGVTGLEDTILFSAPEQPDYFPFPYNQLRFDSIIYAVHNYLDHLLVITSDGMWLVSAAETIAGSIKKRVLTNVYISELDAYNAIVYKDQIFFKADNDFYVLKPNAYTSDSTNLKNYTNSVALANLTKDFENVISDLIQTINPSFLVTDSSLSTKFFDGFDILDCFTVLRNEDIHYIYAIQQYHYFDDFKAYDMETGEIHLVYNTVTRAWRLYVMAYGFNNNHDPLKIEADNISTINYFPLYYKTKDTGTFIEVHPYYKYEYDDPDSEEYTAKNPTILVLKQDSNNKIDSWGDRFISRFWNYAYLDTGNVAIDDMFTKRWREVQFNIKSKQPQALKFNTNFLTDGIKTVDYVKYTTEVLDDDTIVVFPEYWGNENMELMGLTHTGDFETDSKWEIDCSHFPENSLKTVRFGLSGRGRRAQIQLKCGNFRDYELADMTWVYRPMTARQKGERK